MKAKTSPEMKTKKSETRGVQPRNRIKYSANQLHQLEKVFLSTQYPDSSILEDLSNSISVSVERLSIWFQNRRSKFKRQSKNSHVNWMRQQIYHRGTSQSRDASDQSAKNLCHVLSPPAQNVAHELQSADSNPTSNLHYLPSSPPVCSRVTGYDSYSPVTTPLPSTSGSNCYSTTATPTDIPNNTLFLSHLMSDTQEPQSPYYPLPSSGYYSQSNFSSADNQFYHQSYSPYYNFPSTQMNFPQIGV